MDGKFVAVRARIEVGWEGDNFLVDPIGPDGKSPTEAPKLWIFCEPRYAQRVCGPAFDASFGRGYQGAVATFTGYFHFAPDVKAQWKGVFLTGPLQFSAVSVSDLEVPKQR
jgi:hypothetical protein